MSWGMPAILSQSNVLTKQTANYLLDSKLKLHNNMGAGGCCCCSAIRRAAHARPSLIWCQAHQPRARPVIGCFSSSFRCFVKHNFARMFAFKPAPNPHFGTVSLLVYRKRCTFDTLFSMSTYQVRSTPWNALFSTILRSSEHFGGGTYLEPLPVFR